MWGLLGGVIVSVIGGFAWSRFGPGKSWTREALPVIGAISDFSLTNQFGKVTTLADLRGKVWVANVFFSRCPSACPLMNQKLSAVQGFLAKDAPVRLVSITSDPNYDSPEVLKKYGEKYSAQPGRWLFLTGDRKAIFRLVVDDLKLVMIDQKPEARSSPEDLFIHSQSFVIVDRRGQLRGVFDSTAPGVNEHVVAAVQGLTQER